MTRDELKAVVKELRELEAEATPGDWHLGAQNDAVFIVAGRKPALNNDYPVHDAARTPVGLLYNWKSDGTLAIKSRNALIPILDALEEAWERLENE